MSSQPTPPATRTVRINELPVMWLAIGMGAGLLALLPWFIKGAVLPLQNLWQSDTLPDEMPFALLPVSQYYVLFIVGILMAGAALAGLTFRALAAADARNGGVIVGEEAPADVDPAVDGALVDGLSVGSVVVETPTTSGSVPSSAGGPLSGKMLGHLGLGTVQLVIIAQSFWVTGQGIGAFEGGRTFAAIYFWGLLAGVVVAAALSHLVLHLVTSDSRASVAIGWAVAATPLAHWILQLFIAPTGSVPGFVTQALSWAPILITAAALAWCGLAAHRALVAWAVGFALLLAAPAALGAILTVLGSRVYYGDIQAMVSLGIDSFITALPRSLLEAVIGIALAAAIAVPRYLKERQAAAFPAVPPPAAL